MGRGNSSSLKVLFALNNAFRSCLQFVLTASILKDQNITDTVREIPNMGQRKLTVNPSSPCISLQNFLIVPRTWRIRLSIKIIIILWQSFPIFSVFKIQSRVGLCLFSKPIKLPVPVHLLLWFIPVCSLNQSKTLVPVSFFVAVYHFEGKRKSRQYALFTQWPC